MFLFTATFQNMAIPLNTNTNEVLRVTSPNSRIANFPLVKKKLTCCIHSWCNFQELKYYICSLLFPTHLRAKICVC